MGRMTDIDEMMYSCGMEVLHPGGIEKSVEMTEKCGISGSSKILDIGSGKGATACALTRRYGCRIIGIDQNPEMISHASAKSRGLGLESKLEFIQADAYKLPFGNECFDIAIAECSTVLLDKPRIFSEMLRVTKPGGFIGDLEMTWQKTPPAGLEEKVYELWDGFSTMTLPGWKTFFAEHGLTEVLACDFSDKLTDMEGAMMKELGAAGLLRLAFRLLTNPPLLRAMLEYRRIFKTWSDYIGYGYLVGRK